MDSTSLSPVTGAPPGAGLDKAGTGIGTHAADASAAAAGHRGMTGDAVVDRWALTLYVNGASPQSIRAIETVRRQVIAAPTLVKRLPDPLRRIVGDLPTFPTYPACAPGPTSAQATPGTDCRARTGSP